MRIIGIDPGYAIVGYGVLDCVGNDFKIVAFGAITTKAKTPFELRLKTVYEDMSAILDMYKPDEMAIEKLYFYTNQKTVIDVAQARGVTVLPAVERGIKICEYTPLQVKMSVTGYGRAEKKQIQEMVKNILRLKEVPKPDDTADALALAITHGHASHTNATFKISEYR